MICVASVVICNADLTRYINFQSEISVSEDFFSQILLFERIVEESVYELDFIFYWGQIIPRVNVANTKCN